MRVCVCVDAAYLWHVCAQHEYPPHTTSASLLTEGNKPAGTEAAAVVRCATVCCAIQLYCAVLCLYLFVRVCACAERV